MTKTEQKINVYKALMISILYSLALTWLPMIIGNGHVQKDIFWLCVLAGYVVGCVVTIFLPVGKWSVGVTKLLRCKKGTKLFGIVTELIYTLFFALIMSIVMTYFSMCILKHVPLIIAVFAWLKTVFSCYLAAVFITFVCLPPIEKLAKKFAGADDARD